MIAINVHRHLWHQSTTKLPQFDDSLIDMITLFICWECWISLFFAVAVVISTPKSIPYAALIADFFLSIHLKFILRLLHFSCALEFVRLNFSDPYLMYKRKTNKYTKEKHFLFTGTFGSLVEFYTRKLNCISKVILHIFHFHSFSLRLATSYTC